MSDKRFFRWSKCLASAGVLIVLLMLLVPFSGVRADSTVVFPDPNLDAAIRDAIGKPMGDIYQSDLIGLTTLDAQLAGIVDLTGLEHCPGLASLYLGQNQISDLSPLSGLASLATLHLDLNRISDLSPLAGLTGLTWLYLFGNQVADIEPLVNNPGIGSGDHIDLRFNPLNGISLHTYVPALRARGVRLLYPMEGDVTGDGRVTISDAMMIAQYKVGMISLTFYEQGCADTTDDWNVSMADAMHIAQWLVDPTGSLGVLQRPLWESPADDTMLMPVPR